MARETMSVYPRGWFVLCFSDELAVGESKTVRYFGQQLVLYRGEDGAARVLDAYCPHLGANLGVGGKVVGSSIRCPFHAWRFGPDGACVEIPYAKKIPPRACVKAWPVSEKNGVVLVYHDSEGLPPDLEIPLIPEYGTDQWLPWKRSMYNIRTHPREIVENLADRAHFPAVHRTVIEEFGFEVNGKLATQKVKGKALLPGGGVDEFESTTTYHGPGYLLMRMNGVLQNYMLFGHTPIDENNLDLRMAVMLRIVGSRERTEGYVAHYLENLKAGFEDDMKIWENKVFRDRPVLCDGDGPIGQLRKWYRQFYEPREGGAAKSAAAASGDEMR